MSNFLKCSQKTTFSESFPYVGSFFRGNADGLIKKGPWLILIQYPAPAPDHSYKCLNFLGQNVPAVRIEIQSYKFFSEAKNLIE